MQSTLDSLKHKLQHTSQQSSTLLQHVTNKSCQLERARALQGTSGPVYSAMKMVSEQRRLLSDNEEDDRELLAVFIDQLMDKATRISSLMERALDKLERAEREEEETRRAMNKAKEQVHVHVLHVVVIN